MSEKITVRWQPRKRLTLVIEVPSSIDVQPAMPNVEAVTLDIFMREGNMLEISCRTPEVDQVFEADNTLDSVVILAMREYDDAN